MWSVEEDRPSAIMRGGARLRPDIVVLDLDNGSSQRARRSSSRGASPETTVVLWARDEDLMEVLEPGLRTHPRRVARRPEWNGCEAN